MHYGLPESAGPDTVTFVFTLFYINLGLLIFNLLPVYPMDGGQILQALLWYRLGYPKALLIATGIGLAGGVALIALALIYLESVYSALLAGFLLLNCWKAFQAARSMVAAMPPRAS
jgi:Zn-dependent protease